MHVIPCCVWYLPTTSCHRPFPEVRRPGRESHQSPKLRKNFDILQSCLRIKPKLAPRSCYSKIWPSRSPAYSIATLLALTGCLALSPFWTSSEESITARWQQSATKVLLAWIVPPFRNGLVDIGVTDLCSAASCQLQFPYFRLDLFSQAQFHSRYLYLIILLISIAHRKLLFFWRFFPNVRKLWIGITPLKDIRDKFSRASKTIGYIFR